jgi:hypothetical protein
MNIWRLPTIEGSSGGKLYMTSAPLGVPRFKKSTVSQVTN